MACARDTSGSDQEQMTVKIFITSYTDEFFAERNLIKNEILPEVKKWCEGKKLVVVHHFINWGGRHPDQRDVSELEKLQTSIENCYFSSIMPVFINITSSSLGWVPMWSDHAEEVVEEYQEAFGLLYEDLELLSSAFREDNQNSLFLLRDDDFTKGMKEQAKSNFAQATSASQKICGENDKLKHKFPPDRIITFCPKYQGADTKNRPLLAFSDDFKKSVIDFLKGRIAYEYCGEDETLSNDPRLAHLEFLQTRGDSVWGRNNLVTQIENYIIKEDRDIPLILLGASGSGKTSIMCLAAKTILEKKENGQLPPFGDKDDNWRVFYHFVGAVPGSLSLEQMLKRLLLETGMTKKNSNCAKTMDSAAQMCCSMLSNLNTEPLIIFLDGADQFTKEHGARTISWVPRKLAPQVRLVMAMVTETEVHKALLERETKPTQISVTPLDNTSKQHVIEEVFKPDKLSAPDLRNLLDKPLSENPLWLTLACQEIKLVAQDGPTKVEQKIETLPDSLLMLFEELVERLASGPGGDLHIGILCLLEASAAGLNECELRELMAGGSSTMPPSPFEEKEETEEAEKDMHRKKGYLPDDLWKTSYEILQPFLRPYGDSKEGRLDFYHRALSKALRKRYFTEVVDQGLSTGKTERSQAYFFWHRKLANYFRNHTDTVRMVEEYPYQLACLDDRFHLAQCLCEWRVFDRLYHEEYSSQLMAYWRKVGPITEMISSYEAALKKFEEADTANEAAVSVRYEKVCRVTIQAGKHQDALELLKTAMKIEEKDLGARAHRMVDLYSLMSEIFDEKLKLNDFVSRSQVPDLRKTIHYAKKSIHIRKTLPGPYHKYKLGMSLMRLAFNMKSWDATGGGTELSGPDAVIEGNKYIDRALKIFLELNDMGHYAEALMTKGVLAPRGSMEQLKLYNQAMELCMQMYGELHILTSRLYINIGIVYEDNKDYKRSYQYFKKWARLSEEIMGPDHPKTLRAKGVLRESRYRRIAIELGEWVEGDDQFQEAEEEEERSESCEMEHSYDDTVNNLLIVSQEEATLDSALGAGDGPSLVSSSASTSVPADETIQPTFNIVPLAPNSYLQSLNQNSTQQSDDAGGEPRWTRRTQLRDTSRYIRSRLERCDAIRRGVPSGEQQRQSSFRVGGSALLPSINSADTNQRQDQNRFDIVYSFDNLLRELRSSNTSEENSNTTDTLQQRDNNPRCTIPSASPDSNRRPDSDISLGSDLVREMRSAHLAYNLLSIRSIADQSDSPTPQTCTRLDAVPPLAHLRSSLPALNENSTGLSRGILRDFPRSLRTDNSDAPTASSLVSFPHAGDVESALREHETFNTLIARNRLDGSQSQNTADVVSNRGMTPNSSAESMGQVFSNGYVPSDEEEIREADDSDHEGHSDSENFYDDNFEDYDEHYIMSGDGSIVVDELAVIAENEEEPEISNLEGEEIGGRFSPVYLGDDIFATTIERDNRFARECSDEENEQVPNVQQESDEG